ARYVLAKGASPIQEVWSGGKRVAQAQGGRGLYLVDQRGRVAKASADGEKMEVEASGPVAACVRFEGDYKTSEGERVARHVTRVEANAGQPFARVTHTLILTEDTNKVWFREAGWEFAVAAGGQAQAIFGVSRGEPLKTQAVPMDKGTASAWMIQDSHYRHGHGKNHFAVARRPAGGQETTVLEGQECGDFAALAGSEGGLALGCREAARQHPKEFEARPGFLTLKLFSNRAGEEMDFRAEALVKRWDLAGWYEKTLSQSNKKTNPLEKVRKFTSNAAGWGKTHELLIAPVTAAAPQEAAKWAWLLAKPVQAMADPAWICASGAMYRVRPRDRERFPLAEKLIDETFAVWEKRIDDWGDYGFVDYFAGPHLGYKGNYVNPFRYGRFTYSLRADLWLLYARSGERRMRDLAEGTNRAYMDNFFALWDAGEKVAGLCVSGAGDGYDAKGGLPFYWEGISTFNLLSSSNLDQFLWLYYFTGFRHAKDRVEDYGRGALKAWSPQRAKRDWRILATT
ncbi:MAG TPA: hypothetical protein P5137_18295, partial [Candidatus Brocadiia bacterium]|nr:hypothetical protein [Candidatus Brocadiia bacterium]